jgi:4-hydroxy-3-polyprenylbenzoate decarboxylase
MKKIIVGISGATGAIYGIRTVEILRRDPEVEIHLLVTDAGALTLQEETNWTVKDVLKLAHYTYDIGDVGACISSGSFQNEGMIIAPCSIKSMAMIANSIDENLLIRAADVALKERRKLLLLIRETPLHLGHLRQMTHLAEVGAIIFPPVPSFYHKPQTIDDIVNQTVGKVLDQFGINHNLFKRWEGMGPKQLKGKKGKG